MMMLAARKQLTQIGVNLWQTGVRSIFRFYMLRAELTQDEAWANLRVKLSVKCPNAEEYEYQEVRAMLYEEINITVEQAKEIYQRYPNSTPLLDAIRECIQEIDG